jgi:hypothetical protein
MATLVQRVAAVELTQAEYQDRAYALGDRDCLTLAAYHLTALGRPDPLAQVRDYDSPSSAIRALRKAGFENLEVAVSAQGLARIGLASALVGDLVALPADRPFDVALGVHLGGGHALAFCNGVCLVGSAGAALFAWRV